MTLSLLHNNKKTGKSLNFPQSTCIPSLCTICKGQGYCYADRWPLSSHSSTAKMKRNLVLWNSDPDLFNFLLKAEVLSLGSPLLRLSGTGETPQEICAFLERESLLFWDYTRQKEKALLFPKRCVFSVDRSTPKEDFSLKNIKKAYLVDTKSLELPEKDLIEKIDVFFIPDCRKQYREILLSTLPIKKICPCDINRRVKKSPGICFKCRRCLP